MTRSVSRLPESEHASVAGHALAWALRVGERELWIGNGAFVVGRGSEVDLQLDDESVSRRHALFRVGEDEQASVDDLGSRNGTFVNDRRIAGRAQIAAGDVIALGACQLELIHARPRDPFRRAPITQPLLRPLAQPAPGPLDALSARERELFVLLARGVPQREIAEQLGISIKTVETHRTRIGHKLGLRTREELIRCALDNSVLRPSGTYSAADE
jgi:DNA-binding CsgD family transcriptional regulator